MKLNVNEIKKKINKYYFFLYNKNTNNIKLLATSDNSDIIKKIIKKTNKNNIIVRVKIMSITKKQLENEKNSSLKTIGGPLYGLINEYTLENNKIKQLPKKIKNKVYFPSRYLYEIKDNNKQINKDIMKMGLKYTTNKLNNKLLAINKVNKL